MSWVTLSDDFSGKNSSDFTHLDYKRNERNGSRASERSGMEQWLFFYGCVGVFLVLLLLPGFVLSKCCNYASADAIGLAAPLSVVLYCIVAIVYFFTGIRCSALSILFGCLLIVSLICFLARFLKSENKVENGGSDFHVLAVPFIVVLIGFTVGSWIYLRPLGSPETPTMTYDNVFHYKTVTTFLKSGMWSPLNVSGYLDNPNLANILGSQPGYYPAAWHLFAALVCSFSGCSVVAAANIVNYVTAAAIYPLSVYFLSRRLFQNSEISAAFSALAAVLSACMPWGFLDYWPLYPNLLSMSLVPVGIGLFLDFCRASNAGKRCVSLVLFLVAVASFYFAQPNSAFSVAAYLIPYVVYFGSKLLGRLFAKRLIQVRPIVIIAITSVAICLAWFFVTKLPFLQGVVQFYWPPIFGKREAISHIFDLSLSGIGKQPELGILVVLGLFLVLRNEDLRWIGFSFLLIVFIYFVASTEQNTVLKHAVAGFWYTDPYRVGALLSFSAAPLAGFALGKCCDVLSSLFPTKQEGILGGERLVLPLSVVVCFFVLAIIGYSGRVDTSKDLPNNLAGLKDALNQDMYSDDERSFVEQAFGLIDSDSLVMNMPYDGSLFAYAIDGFPCVYRDMSGYGGTSESNVSAVLRTSLSEAASNAEVAAALRRLNAKYLLLLHRDVNTNLASFPDYVEEQWSGFESITDDTPGFKVLLSEGDMRLYEMDLD